MSTRSKAQPSASSSATPRPPAAAAATAANPQPVVQIQTPVPEVVIQTTEKTPDDEPSDHNSDDDDEESIPADKPPKADKGKERDGSAPRFIAREPTPAPATFVDTDTQIKLGPPPVFANNSTSLEDLLFYCEMEFAMKPRTYNREPAKVLYLVSHLNKDAFSWARSVLKKNPQAAHNYEAFTIQLCNLYGSNDELSALEAQTKLETLKQTGSASSYTALFEQYTSLLGFNDKAKEALYRRGLKPHLRRALASTNETFEDYDDLCRAAIKLDHNLFAVDKSEKTVNKSTNVSSSGSSEPKAKKKKGKNTSSGSGSSGTSAPRGPLSTAERERRIKEKLCLYCAGAGHSVKDCKVKPKNNSANATLPPNALPASVSSTLDLKSRRNLLTQ